MQNFIMIRIVFLLFVILFSQEVFAKSSPASFIDKAQKQLPKECLFYFKMYLNAKSPKAFAYSFETHQKVTCRFSSNSKNQAKANEVALASCEKSRLKKQIIHPCKLYILDSNVSKTKEKIAFEKKYLINLQKIQKTIQAPKRKKHILQKTAPKEAKKPHKEQTQKKKHTTPLSLMKSPLDTLPKECVMFYKMYLQAPKHKAFAIAFESDNKYACKFSAKASSKEKAKEIALHSCNKRSKEKSLHTPCRLYEALPAHKKSKPAVKPVTNKMMFKDQQLNKALKKAILSANLRKIKALIQQGADVNTKAADNSRALFVAVAQGDVAFTKDLLAKKANVFFRNKDGNNLLVAAIMSGKVSLLKLMLEQKIDPNLRCEEGNTPLHFALMMFDDKMMKLLYHYGARDTIKNNKGKSVQDLAKEFHIHLKRIKR